MCAVFSSGADFTQRLGQKKQIHQNPQSTDLTMPLEISSATLDSIAAEFGPSADAGPVATTAIVRTA